MCVCAQSYLALSAPSQSTRDLTGRGRGTMSLTNIASRDAERPQAGRGSSLQRQRLPQVTLHTLHLSLVSFRDLPSSACLNAAVDARFPPAPISSCSAWDQQMVIVCKKEHFAKDRLWSLFFSLLVSEQLVPVLLSAEVLWNPSVENAKDLSLAIHPGARKAGPHQAVQTMSCCWSCCRQGSGRSCRLETEIQPWHWPVRGWPCQAAPAHQHSPTCLLTTVAFALQVCRLVAHTAN